MSINTPSWTQKQESFHQYRELPIFDYLTDIKRQQEYFQRQPKPVPQNNSSTKDFEVLHVHLFLLSSNRQQI